MLNMTSKTREFLRVNIPSFSPTSALGDILDKLDDLMLDSLTSDYEPTELTRQIETAYDDLYLSN